jgi:hypothetical protein
VKEVWHPPYLLGSPVDRLEQQSHFGFGAAAGMHNGNQYGPSVVVGAPSLSAAVAAALADVPLAVASVEDSGVVAVDAAAVKFEIPVAAAAAVELQKGKQAAVFS